MGIERLKQLIMQYKESESYYLDAKNAYNETECRDEYISPLLECFGWDVHNKKGKLPQYKEVVVEKFSNSSERPDYTLTLNGVSKLFVEAKKPSVDITVEFEPAMQTKAISLHPLPPPLNVLYHLAYTTPYRNRPDIDMLPLERYPNHMQYQQFSNSKFLAVSFPYIMALMYFLPYISLFPPVYLLLIYTNIPSFALVLFFHLAIRDFQPKRIHIFSPKYLVQ